MAHVEIKGVFNNSSNNRVNIHIYNADTDIDPTIYLKSFTEPHNDFTPGAQYTLDAVGHTTGSFTLTITGDVEHSSSLNGKNNFQESLTFTVKNT